MPDLKQDWRNRLATPTAFVPASAPQPRVLKIAILGFGTVGTRGCTHPLRSARALASAADPRLQSQRGAQARGLGCRGRALVQRRRAGARLRCRYYGGAGGWHRSGARLDCARPGVGQVRGDGEQEVDCPTRAAALRAGPPARRRHLLWSLGRRRRSGHRCAAGRTGRRSPVQGLRHI